MTPPDIQDGLLLATHNNTLFILPQELLFFNAFSQKTRLVFQRCDKYLSPNDGRCVIRLSSRQPTICLLLNDVTINDAYSAKLII